MGVGLGTCAVRHDYGKVVMPYYSKDAERRRDGREGERDMKLTREAARDLAKARIAELDLEDDIEIEEDATVELATDGSFAYVTVNLFVRTPEARARVSEFERPGVDYPDLP